MSRLRIHLILLILAAATMGCAAFTLKDLESSYEDKCAEITVEKENALKTLRKGYLAALKRIGEKYQKAGNLDAVLLTKDEAILIEGGKWPLPAVPGEIALEVNGPRKIYLKSYLKIEQEAAKDLVDTADKMLALLDEQTTELTKSGDIQSAQLAQQIKKDILGDAEIASARNLMQNVRSDGSSRPALRIRRYGDNIEVLVSYDMRGKISMDSSVRNVEESDKSIGDTSAKVLGEFVGAKGFEVDPYVAADRTFDLAGSEQFSPKDTDVAFKHVEANETGVRLSFKPGGKFPYVHLGNLLPTTDAPGLTRITTSYFIPEKNKSLIGLYFIQGLRGGREFGGTKFNEKGEWTTAPLEALPTTDQPDLLLYLDFSSDVTANRSTREYIVIKEIKVEHIKFTSSITQRLGEHGIVLEEFKDPANQPKLTENGELLPQPAP